MRSSSDRKGRERLVAVGRIKSAHGVAGRVLVRPYTESGDFFLPGGRLCVRRGEGEPRELAVVEARPHGNVLLMALEGVADRDRALELAGAELLVPRSILPEPEEGEYYHADLLGMRVKDPEGAFLGTVESIIETGANDVLVVRDGKKEVLVPVLDWVVLDVDVGGRALTVDLPEGL